MELVRKFSGLGKNDAAIAGGKGASLGEMTRARIPVPPGFVVLAASFEHFLTKNNLHSEIDAVLHQVNYEDIASVDAASEKIRSLIVSATMPADVAQLIYATFNELATDFVAVRSSATAEDSSTAAWAGQLESYLNTTRDNVLQRVQECWSSLFTPRAIFYRHEQNLHEKHVSVAVVVQKMVQSEVSGIAFSVHPVIEDYNQLIIEGAFGLGEAIVSGQITPDSFVVEKSPRQIVEKNITVQRRALVRAKEGNAWRELSTAEGAKPALTERQVLELAELVIKIEKHYGFPCDIEWAYEAGQFFIVQSRPITTLSKKQSEKPRPALFIKTSVRDFSLGFVETRYKGIVKLLNLLGIDLGPDQIFYLAVNNSGVITSYLDPNILGQVASHLVDKISSDKDFLKHLYQNFEQCSSLLKTIWVKKYLESEKELTDFTELFIDALAYGSMLIILPTIELLPKAVQDRGLKYRAENDEIGDYGDQLIKNTITHWLPKITNYEKFVLLEELQAKSSPSLNELRKRKGRYIYTNKIITNVDPEDFASQNNINFEKDLTTNTSELKGETAYKGRVKGKVKIILLKEKLDTVKDGDILVSSMTTPLFIPAMKRAAAFITDEGGITCHAAIVAREMKKPCIIGTKIATQVLKDGDTVEVDADRGIVKILNNKQ